jgi:hypothetical protein
LKVDYWLAMPLGILGVVIAASLARWAAPENARRMIQVTVTGYGQDTLVAFERTVSAAALPRVLAVSGAPDLEHVGALAWPISEADAAAIVGPVPPGLAYRLEGVRQRMMSLALAAAVILAACPPEMSCRSSFPGWHPPCFPTARSWLRHRPPMGCNVGGACHAVSGSTSRHPKPHDPAT